MLDMLKVTINDVEKTLRPSISALRKIEDTLKMSIGEIGQALQLGKVSTSLIVETVFYGIQAAGESATRADIEKHLEENGLDSLNEALVRFFLTATLGKVRAGEVLIQLQADQAQTQEA